jgi:hexulose-6-phosphate isomerase
MKPAINQWAFGEVIPATKAMSMAKEAGFDAFEVCVGVKGPVKLDATEADATALRKHAGELGLELQSVASGLGWDFPMTSADRAVRDKGREAVGKALQIAQWLGAETLLTVPGIVSGETPYDVAMENAIKSIDDLLPVAERCKVSLGIENVWNKFLLSPLEMRDFIDQFQSPYVGAFFDIGNAILTGFPEQWIRILGKRIRMIHAKDFRAGVGTLDGFVMLLEGSVDWPRVMSALREIGYDGALTAEYWPYPHGLETTLRHVAASLEAIMAL